METIYVPIVITTQEHLNKLPGSTLVRDIASELWAPPEHITMLPTVALVSTSAEVEWGSSRPEGGAWECESRQYAEYDAFEYNREGPSHTAEAVCRLTTSWMKPGTIPGVL